MPKRYTPTDDFAAQIAFALKWEGLDLGVLDALFRRVRVEAVADAVRTVPTGTYMRRLWFVYEWLRDERLDLPDLGKVKAVDAVDAKQQIALKTGPISARHKVRNNLPGTREFCPMVRRTTRIKNFENEQLAERADAVLKRIHPDIMSRAAAFLLLSDSRASFRIEGEEPSPDRARRWGQAIARAGTTRLSIEEFKALQRIVIGDARFVKLGLRNEGGFVGEHDRLTGAPLPDHISARPDDLVSLLNGLVDYDERAGRGEMEPVVAAAVEAFGFVYIHPFEDGNGRIHRWLIHHILAASGFAPHGLAFPVSAVMLRELPAYRRVLESYSRPLLDQVEWRATDKGNVEVLNDTAAWYRFFDATVHAEFVYHCVKATIEQDLPSEVAFLEAYDKFVKRVKLLIDMPGGTLDLLYRFLAQNNGRLSIRAREREFAALTDEEAERIEAIYADVHASDSKGLSEAPE
ncbi:MAG TPA: Fic family protein [Gemmatimonadaceae bacterium]|nr:Fic family protein [Gemmatimonadaceae bacterium]